jgi:hypothetical protein
MEEPTATPLEMFVSQRIRSSGRVACGDLRSSAGHLAEKTATAARCGRSLLGSGRGRVLVGRRSGGGAGLASLSRLLGRRARLRSRDGGALGRRGGTAGLARHDCWVVRFCWCLGRCWRVDGEMRLAVEVE